MSKISGVFAINTKTQRVFNKLIVVQNTCGVMQKYCKYLKIFYNCQENLCSFAIIKSNAKSTLQRSENIDNSAKKLRSFAEILSTANSQRVFDFILQIFREILK